MCETDERREDVIAETCDQCGRDAFTPISLAGVGIACSRACMDQLAAKHEAAMMRRHKVSA